MNPQIPAAIKAADLARFAMRASQLEKAKPVISYYCNFWMVNQILKRNLHSTDQECLDYTTSLMDKLEQFKSENLENDAVTDDLAGKAYVEQFGLETLQRADNAVRANKASRQTADTYQAAATFLELMQSWGDLDAENAAKVKYAKYHALRIAKALKAGQDPNASNPVLDSNTVGEDDLPALDPNDAEVQMLNGGPAKPRQPSVVDVPDEAYQLQSHLARQSSLDESLHPSRASSVPRPSGNVPRPKVTEIPDETNPQHTQNDEVSPVEASASAEDFYQQSTHDDVSPIGTEPERKSSVGGNYFPQVQPSDPQHPFTLPSAPSDFTATSPPPEPTLPPTSAAAFSPSPPTLLPQPQIQSQTPSSHHPQPPTPHYLPQQQHPQPAPQYYPHPTPHHQYQPPPPQNYAQPSHPAAAAAPIDEEAISKAQKHARWAISALNFEDVPTAIKELRGALETLGAR